MEQKSFTYYIDRYREGAINQQEWEHLRLLLREPQYQQELKDLMYEQLEQGAGVNVCYPEVVSRIQAQVAMKTVNRRIPMRMLRWAAAALIFLVAGAGTYFLINRQQSRTPVMAATIDVAPGSSKAVLTLGDGSRLTLDSLSNQVIQQGATAVRQQGGQLQYDVQESTSVVSYNTLATPRGGQFKVRLPDGSLAWLNAASTIRYPTVFVGKERKVLITGEVYFEVAPDKEKPFKVISDHQAIEVLGTHFNVHSYGDEECVKTTLLEGSVKIGVGNGDVAILKPGEQSVVKQNIIKVVPVNTDDAIAWINNTFVFTNEDLGSIMKEISRWYDIEVICPPELANRKFSGTISRQKSIQEVLEVMNLTKTFHFKIEGRKITVIP